MFAAMSLVASLAMTLENWPVKPVTGLPKSTAVAPAVSPSHFTPDGPGNDREGTGTRYQDPPPRPPQGFTLVEPEPERRITRLTPPFDIIEVGDWVPRGGGTDVFLLTQRARQPGHIWVRWEYLAPALDEVLSVRDLTEFDCGSWRTRIVQQTLFSQSNLQGEPDTTGYSFAQWEFAAPGTLSEAILEAACSQ